MCADGCRNSIAERRRCEIAESLAVGEATPTFPRLQEFTTNLDPTFPKVPPANETLSPALHPLLSSLPLLFFPFFFFLNTFVKMGGASQAAKSSQALAVKLTGEAGGQ